MRFRGLPRSRIRFFEVYKFPIFSPNKLCFGVLTCSLFVLLNRDKTQDNGDAKRLQLLEKEPRRAAFQAPIDVAVRQKTLTLGIYRELKGEFIGNL